MSTVRNGQLQINPYSEEAKDLVFCAVSLPQGGMQDLVSREYGTRNGNADTGVSTEEGILDSLGDDASKWEFNTAAHLTSLSTPYTVVTEAILTGWGVDDNKSLMTVPTSGGAGTTPIRHAIRSPSGGHYAIGRSTHGMYADLTGDLVFLNQRHWSVFSYNGAGSYTNASNFKCYVNGIELTVYSGTAFTNRTNQYVVMGTSSATNDWIGGFRQTRLYLREWSYADAIRFWNPSTRDNLFAPPKKYFNGHSLIPAGGVFDVFDSGIITGA